MQKKLLANKLRIRIRPDPGIFWSDPDLALDSLGSVRLRFFINIRICLRNTSKICTNLIFSKVAIFIALKIEREIRILFFLDDLDLDLVNLDPPPC